MFTAAYIADSTWNDTAWRETPDAIKFNGIVLAARAELDDKKRRSMYAEAQQLISDDGGAIVPMFANHIHALSKKVAHSDTIAGNWQLDGHKSTERWWFA
jgi:peptide/nickel transport system substrate-binding protein